MMKRDILVVVVLGMVFSGCGAILNGSRQSIFVQSIPRASFRASALSSWSNQTEEFMTPMAIELSRKEDYTLTFSKPGYSQANIQISHSLQKGIVILDVLMTGLVGVIVDAATGCWFRLKPDDVIVSLVKWGNTQVDGLDQIDIQISRREGQLLLQSAEPVLVTVRINGQR